MNGADDPSNPDLQAALSENLGIPVSIRHREPLGGSGLHPVECLHTSAGRFFLKTSRDPRPGLFASEAEGLKALNMAASPICIPRAISFRDPTPTRAGFLVTEFLEPGPRGLGFEEELGRGLAAIHRSSRPSFGFDVMTYCGGTPQPNPWTDDWLTFYRTHRLQHQLQLGRAAGLFSAADQRAFFALFDRLDDRLNAPHEPPALIHGDLWSGNVHASGGRPVLFDPAAYFGHREAEFGMITLFGGFSPATYAAYQEVHPLADGWRERNPLYQLYHLMNHANLFGGHYVRSATDIARRYA
jgi:protein-ribulosamine 3-kinase